MNWIKFLISESPEVSCGRWLSLNSFYVGVLFGLIACAFVPLKLDPNTPMYLAIFFATAGITGKCVSKFAENK